MAPRETRVESGAPQRLSKGQGARLIAQITADERASEAKVKATRAAVAAKTAAKSDAAACAEPAKKPLWIPKARALHNAYVELRDSYVAWLSEDTRAKRLYLAEWCRALQKQDQGDYGSRLHGKGGAGSRLEQFENVYRADSKVKRKAYEEKCKAQVELMALPGFLEELAALTPDEQDDVVAELLGRVGESDVGRTYFAQQIETPASMLSKTVFKSTRKANTAFWRVLGESGATITVLKGKDTIQYVEKLIVSKIDVAVVDILRAEYVLHPAGAIVAVREPVTITVFSPEKVAAHPHFKAQRTVVSQAFDALNLALALWALKEKQGPKEIFSAVGALAGLLDKLSKSTKILTVNSLLKGGAKMPMKVSVLAVVAGACEAVTSSIDAYDRYTKGDYNASFAYGVGAAAGTVSAIGAGLILWGAGTAWVAGFGVILLMAGAVVSVGALIAGFFLDDNPLELWVANCEFGEDYGKNSAYATFKGHHEAQIDALHKILTGARFEGEFEKGSTHVTVRPGMVLCCSKVWVTMTYQWDLGSGCAWRDTLIDERWGVKTEGQKVTEITLLVPGMFSTRDVVMSEVDIAIKVDVYGDGKTLVYEQSAKVTPTLLEGLSKWF